MKFQNFSIAKIEFLWRTLNFKRGHGPPGPPFSAAYVNDYAVCLGQEPQRQGELKQQRPHMLSLETLALNLSLVEETRQLIKLHIASQELHPPLPLLYYIPPIKFLKPYQ